MTKRTKKILKITFISLATLLAILGGIAWYIANNLEKVVKFALVEEVEESTDGLYALQMGELNINLANGVLHIDDIQFSIDSIKLYELEVRGEKPIYTTNFSASSIEINVDKLLRIRKGGNLNVSHISVIEPKIDLTYSDNKTKHNNAKPELEKTDLKLPFFNSVTIENIEILNGNLSYHAQREKDTAIFVTNSFSFNSTNIRVDSLINLRNPLVHVDDAFLEANNIRHFMLDSALLLAVKQLSINVKDSLVHVDSLVITPQYKKFEFTYKTPNHSDIIDLSIKDIALSGVHFNDFFNEKKLVIESIGIDSLSFWSFKNKQIPPKVPKVKPLFHQLIHQIKIPISVNSITVSNSNASYEELSLNGDSPGKIHFTDLSAEIIGLTNIVSDKKQLYTAKAKGKIYGKSMVEAIFRFPIDSLNDYFEVNGHVGKMDLSIINSMIVPLANVEIKSGVMQQMDFSISGNSSTSKTNMTFLYNDLKVELLKSKKENHSERKFLSGIVNTLLIKSNNPSGKKEPRKATAVTSERDRFLSNFNYWWRSIRGGMIYSLGIPGK